MMFGRGANPIFFNNKKKIRRPEHSLPPTPARLPPASYNILFLPSTPPPLQGGRHMCTTPDCIWQFDQLFLVPWYSNKISIYRLKD